jgi:hypothetical protein
MDTLLAVGIAAATGTVGGAVIAFTIPAHLDRRRRHRHGLLDLLLFEFDVGQKLVAAQELTDFLMGNRNGWRPKQLPVGPSASALRDTYRSKLESLPEVLTPQDQMYILDRLAVASFWDDPPSEVFEIVDGFDAPDTVAGSPKEIRQRIRDRRDSGKWILHPRRAIAYRILASSF